MLDEDIRGITCQHIPQDPSAGPGDHAHEYQQKQPGTIDAVIRRFNAQHGEDPKSRRVHPEQNQVIAPLIPGQQMADAGQK